MKLRLDSVYHQQPARKTTITTTQQLPIGVLIVFTHPPTPSSLNLLVPQQAVERVPPGHTAGEWPLGFQLLKSLE